MLLLLLLSRFSHVLLCAGNPLQCSCLENPRDGGAWWAAVYGVAQRPFRYNLNQIPYNYTVEVTNRLKRLDLITGVPEELWMEAHDITGGSDQDHPQKKEMQKGKIVV